MSGMWVRRIRVNIFVAYGWRWDDFLILGSRLTFPRASSSARLSMAHRQRWTGLRLAPARHSRYPPSGARYRPRRTFRRRGASEASRLQAPATAIGISGSSDVPALAPCDFSQLSKGGLYSGELNALMIFQYDGLGGLFDTVTKSAFFRCGMKGRKRKCPRKSPRSRHGHGSLERCS